MENETSLPQSEKKSDFIPRKKFFKRVLVSKALRYTFMVAMLMFILLCGYFLYYGGSLFIEAIWNGWYRADTGEFERESLYEGFFWGFSSLFGFIGGLSVMATTPARWYKYKILLFIPAVVWSTLQVLYFAYFSFPMRYCVLWSLHIAAMLLCMFVLFGVIVKICIPYLESEKPAELIKKKDNE